MADPLLSTLCQICHIKPPKYTCPRCTQQTCSLTCSKRHKLWSSCNGIRDPTIFRPLSTIATPSGIDHDYNFIHSIEHHIERSEKKIIERALLRKEELEGGMRRGGGRRVVVDVGEEPIRERCREMRLQVLRAPKGMQRSRENGTNWSKRRKAVHWQVEWFREEGEKGGWKRVLSKVMDCRGIGEVYGEVCEAERKSLLSNGEKVAERKRRREENAEQSKAKRTKVEEESMEIDHLRLPVMQDPQSGAWNVTSTYSTTSLATEESTTTKSQPPQNHHFYLHRPLTPSSYPKVIVPLHPSATVCEILRYRKVLEFPTIYVMQQGPEVLPEGFMLENDYVAVTGDVVKQDLDVEMSDLDEDVDGSEEDEISSSDTSSSGSSNEEEDSDEEMEEGEIVVD